MMRGMTQTLDTFAYDLTYKKKKIKIKTKHKCQTVLVGLMRRWGASRQESVKNRNEEVRR